MPKIILTLFLFVLLGLGAVTASASSFAQVVYQQETDPNYTRNYNNYYKNYNYNNCNYYGYNNYYNGYCRRPGIVVYRNQIANIADNIQEQNPEVSMNRVAVQKIRRSDDQYNIYWQARGAVQGDSAANAVCTYTSNGMLDSRMQYPAGTVVGVSGVTRYTPDSNQVYASEANTTVRNVRVLR